MPKEAYVMDGYQIAMLLVLAAFYAVYFGKMLMQRRQGIVTNQMGRGDKPRRTLWIERLLSVATFAIVPAEIGSILWNTRTASRGVVILGIALAALGVGVFAIAVWTMRDSWRAGIPDADKTTLVTKGIYRLSRNPAFLGFDLIYIGTLIAFFNWVHLAFCLFAVVMMHLQILEEERFLPQAFGKSYAEYRQRTARYFLFI